MSEHQRVSVDRRDNRHTQAAKRTREAFDAIGGSGVVRAKDLNAKLDLRQEGGDAALDAAATALLAQAEALQGLEDIADELVEQAKAGDEDALRLLSDFARNRGLDAEAWYKACRHLGLPERRPRQLMAEPSAATLRKRRSRESKKV